ncbi:glycoside hydrolase [uncultured Roseivirga sp.]|uniref:WD40/YVTN/BNR-like repeat-containing protein n=1 Tax=uncultured Roseivirga sp. TaxID=543088 RepID=UPI0030D6D632|tara:strand:+ start:41509 stop:44556 length:3048 start_codon:yes stop_codon:yes gene_type:complete
MRTLFAFFLLFLSQYGFSQSVPKSAYQDMEYRMIGPFRAGRTVGAVGIPTQPNVFFMGVNNGGVWKTDDYGRTWNPIFDEAPTGSVGDIAVSPSNPNVIYVGTGEGLHRPDLSVGDGMFKSTDGGKKWQFIGLGDIQQIARVIVHPTNPDIVFVAGLGHPYGANEMRGVFRSKDGGKNWEKVLYINHNTGSVQVEFDPSNPNVLFADMWEHQEGPWENASFSGPNSGLYKSTDGGTSWKKIEKGLPTVEQGLGRIGIGISPSNSKRIYATVDARQNGGVYRSDDGGESWSLIAEDRRLWGRGSDFAEIRVHPKNPDLLYVANVAAYRSEDGGKTWMSFKGAPGGDDYHRIWINPLQPDIMLFAADQGAVVTVNAGKTWSSWYNQPTSQLYHIITDNNFPYWVYGGQQESGAIGVASRGNGGQISFREFMGVGADEYAYVAPDPKDPNIIYGGRVTRFNKKTGQNQNVAPEALRSGDFRGVRTMPLIFHPADDHMLLFGTNVLWKTMNGGQDWEVISPDLTRKQPEVPASVGDFKTESMNTMPQRAIIYAIGPSPLDRNIIWAGTDDGLVQLTRDGGKTWKNVTPPQLKSWDKISQLDAGHFDKGTVYVAVNSIRKDDMRPHIYKTHDFGATWQEVVKGMEINGPVNVVREDSKQKGLLYAGTEREVYFSINDGADWQSLRLNMPASSIRDLVVHESDLVIGTHGRSIWILDDVSPLRGLAAGLKSSDPVLFEPSLATRVRFNMFSDTPVPPEEPNGQNPYDGVAIDYLLPKQYGTVKLEILNGKGVAVRTYSSKDLPEKIDSTDLRHPTYWLRPQQSLGTSAGHHRFIWDLKYDPPRGANRSFSIAAVYKNTPSDPSGPYVHPGKYTVRLTVDGKTSEQSIHVRIDPRTEISASALQQQTDLSLQVYNNYHQAQSIIEAIDQQLNDPKRKWKTGEKDKLQSFRGNGAANAGDFIYGSISASPLERESLVGLQSKFLYMLSVLQSVEAQPTNAVVSGIEQLELRLKEMLTKWDTLK